MAILCETSIVFNGIELIGTKQSEIEEILGTRISDDISYIDMPDGQQEVLEFDELALQIWCKDKTVVSVIVNPEYDDMEASERDG